MREQQYQKKIIDKYKGDGWYVINTIKTNVNGIPDLILLKDNHPATFIECKTPTGKLSKIQEFRLDELSKKGFDCYVSYGDDIRKWKIIDKKKSDIGF